MGDDQYQERRFYGPPPDGPAPPSPPKPKPKPRKQAPQDTIKQFWEQFNSKYPGKVFTILPDNVLARKKAAKTPKGAVKGVRVAKSYEEAKAECERDVNRITRECRRTNQKYKDPHFDMEVDLKLHMRDCIDSLKGDSGMKPRGVKRLTDIFEKPQFYIDDPTSGDVRQGRDGDCYLMAALCGLGNMKGLIERVCIKHDDLCQMCGVYGFVFFRDGEWQTTIIDDKLYLRVPDYDEAVGQEERLVWDDVNRKDSEDEYRKTHQTGSRALFFAQCSDENETWLPLLEKAFAKAHGDYASIDGGFTGEALEDLTGGVTSEMYSTDILDKEAFWRDELMKVNQDFLFGCATGAYSSWLENNPNAPLRERQGIFEGHAYSIMEARELEVDGVVHRLVKLRNPWGKKEWQGRWSDGSSEWNAKWFELLNHKFGNDGIFWISYQDLLQKYQHFDRTRIFSDNWHVTQKWTSLHIPWTVDYHSTKFRLTLKEQSPVVIVLSQLDSDYFKGLEGSYNFDLQFRLETEDDDDNDYIVRSHQNYVMVRSVSTDIELNAGTYSIFIKITATPNSNEKLEELLPGFAKDRREKLTQVGMSYDLAHAKGIFVESEQEKERRVAKEKAKKLAEREKEKQRLRANALKDWEKNKMYHNRDKRAREKREKANARRRARGRSPSRDDYGGEAGSMNAARGGSLDDLPPDAGKNRSKDTMRESKNLPLRSKSFSGEPFALNTGATVVDPATEEPTQAAQDAEQDSVAAAVADVINQVNRKDEEEAAAAEADPSKTNSASEIVQSLNAMIANADAHTTAAKIERTGDVDATLPMPTVQVNGIDVVTDVKPLSAQPVLSSLDAVDDVHVLEGGRSDIPLVPEVTKANSRVDEVDAVANRPSPADQTAGISGKDHLQRSNDDDDTSSIDSFPSFKWHSGMSSYSSSSDFADPVRSRVNRVQPPLDGSQVREEIDMGDLEPWNAVCVVGLRVYSLLEGKGVVLEVVKPEEGDDEEGKGEKAGLDRDDPSKSLVEVEGVGGVEVERGEGKGEPGA